jgi:hypothetical protein
MGEYIPSPHPESKSMSADGAKYLQAVSIAQQTGKSVEEVLSFMGVAKPAEAPTQVVENEPHPEGILPEALKDATLPLPPVQEEEVKSDAKALASKKVPAPDETGFVVTEVVNPEEATEKELDQLYPNEDEQDWSGRIRKGSRVKVTYSVPGSKIKWSGKIGTVVREIGNEKAKVYEVEFKGQKIPKVRLNKKTGKLERGYINKKLATTFCEEDLELVD